MPQALASALSTLQIQDRGGQDTSAICSQSLSFDPNYVSSVTGSLVVSDRWVLPPLAPKLVHTTGCFMMKLAILWNNRKRLHEQHRPGFLAATGSQGHMNKLFLHLYSVLAGSHLSYLLANPQHNACHFMHIAFISHQKALRGASEFQRGTKHQASHSECSIDPPGSLYWGNFISYINGFFILVFNVSSIDSIPVQWRLCCLEHFFEKGRGFELLFKEASEHGCISGSFPQAPISPPEEEGMEPEIRRHDQSQPISLGAPAQAWAQAPKN